MTTGWSFGQLERVSVQPFHLVPADPRPGSGDRAVERRHVAHALLGRHLLRRPVVRPARHGVQPDEPDALVVERPVGLAEEGGPLLAHVEVPVVLPGDEHFPDLHFLEEVRAEIQLDRIAELGQVPAVDHEVSGRAHRLDFLERPDRLLHEPGVDVLRVEMVVGHPGEAERRLLPVGEVKGVDEGEPAVGRGARGPRQHRPVDERPPGDLDRRGWGARPVDSAWHASRVGSGPGRRIFPPSATRPSWPGLAAGRLDHGVPRQPPPFRTAGRALAPTSSSARRGPSPPPSP